MEQTIVIKLEGCVTNAKREHTDADDSRMEFSSYARFFDETCAAWSKDAEMNKYYLMLQQNYANERLRHQGYLFLNDVYDMLGMARTKAGQIVGWVYREDNPIGDNYVDFDICNSSNRDFINGVDGANILLDFNVDGCILDYI